jgi:hypothetical protein
LKSKFDSNSSFFYFNRLASGTFNMGLKRSTCAGPTVAANHGCCFTASHDPNDAGAPPPLLLGLKVCPMNMDSASLPNSGTCIPNRCVAAQVGIERNVKQRFIVFQL